MIDGRLALVTGAARGIGAGVAARLARDAWQVLGVDRDTFTAPSGVRAVVADVSDEAAVAALMAALGGRLDAGQRRRVHAAQAAPRLGFAGMVGSDRHEHDGHLPAGPGGGGDVAGGAWVDRGDRVHAGAYE
jgi:NAD(P)-dependent dehydrogenase (short-subunit alcohol dehydrogenase family)